MAGQNPRDMREWMRTLERKSGQQRPMAAVVNEAVKEVEREREVEKVRRPAPPIELEAQTGYYTDVHLRRTRVRVNLDFPDVIFNTDGTRANIQQYELWGYEEVPRDGDELPAEPAWQRQAVSPTSGFRAEGYIPGKRWTFRVRAISLDSVQPGEWSDEFTVQMAKDSTPPPQPTAPVVESSRGQLIVTWDGKAVSGDMPRDFSYAILAHGTAANPTKEFAQFGKDGGIAVYTGAAYSVPQFFRIRAVDESGQMGPWSEQVTGITKPLVDVDIIISELDAGQTRIKNAKELILEDSLRLGDKLQSADEAIAGVDAAVNGPAGVKAKVDEATRKLADVGSLAYEAGKTLRQKLAENDAAQAVVQGEILEVQDVIIPRLDADLTATKTRLSTAETDINAAEAEIASTKTDLAAAKKQITDNKVITDAAAVRLGTAEGEITSAKTRLGTAETNINTLKNTTIPKLNTDLSSAAGRITSAEQSLQLIPGDIQSAKEAAIAAAYAEAEEQAAAAKTAAAADAKTKADKALADAKADATSKANAAQAAAIAAADIAARATAKAEAEAAEARAAATAAADAKTKADAAQAAALAAAKTYADAQANDAGELALEEARADATAKADAAQAAAIAAAAAETKAKTEAAEARAALDAKTKADNALAFALGAAPRGENVVVNPGFDQHFTGWDLENATTTDQFGIDSTVSRTGGRSFWTTGRGGFRQQGIPVVAGQTWEFALWYLTEPHYSRSNAGGLRLQAIVNGTWADVASSTLGPAADWTRSMVRYVVPAGVTQIRVRFAFNYSGGAKCWVDDIELMNITADLAAAADAQAKADAALAAATAANVETNKQLAQLAANAGNMAPYGNLESLSGSYFPLNAAEARSGERAFTRRLGTTDAGYALPAIPVTPLNWYQISFWMKADRDITTNAGMIPLWVRMDGTEFNGNWGEGYTPAQRGPLSMEWKLVTFTVQAAANMKAVRPRFYVWSAASSHPDNGATVYMDDFTMKDVTEYKLALAADDQVRLEAFAAADRASAEAREAAGLANSMGRTWFQPEAPDPGVVYSWAGTPNESQSIQAQNGVELRRNYFADPNNVTGKYLTWTNNRWFGGSPSAGRYTNETGPTPTGNTFKRKTWTVAPERNGDTGFDLILASNAVPVTAGEVWTFSAYMRSSVSGKLAIATLHARKADGTTSRLTPGPATELAAGEWERRSVTVTIPEGVVSIQPVADIYTGGTVWAVGDYLDGTGALLEKAGTVGDYFDGGTPDDRETDLWIDTDDGNTPKRWNGAGWSAVTDTKAIEAAKTAAAADATAKANAALAAAKADATAKADAAAAEARAAQAAAVNIFPDPSFEAGLRPFTSGRYVYDTAEKRSGLQSLRCNAGTASTTYTAATFLIRPGETWALYAWVKTSEDYNGNGDNGKMRLANGDGSLRTAYTWTKSPNGWTRVGGTITQSADGVTNTVQIQLSINHTVGTLWLDDFEVRNITEELRLAAEATAKAEAARVLAEKNAAADATAKTEAAKTALTNALTADAAAKIATAKQEALTAAAADAASKANAAKDAAEQAAATHAAGLASGAQQAAIDAAATDAAAKAAAAQQAAIDAAATEAARVAGLAQTNAINAARNTAVELANAAKADAIDAAALDASFKADEAERRAKADAATAQARAEKAVTDAAAAAGLADSKTKTLIQSAAPAAADRNAKVLWIDTTNGANTPKVWVASSNSWVARTDKVATDAASRAAQAITDASNAAAAAGRAQTAADNAMSAAGSKTTILTSTSNPSGIAAVGTIWRKEDAQHNIIGTWRYVGGANPWQAELVSSDMIDNLDVGKLTANTAVVNELVAQKIAAATASFQRVDAKNLFVTGTATLEEAVARRLAAETGTFISLTTDQLVAGSGNINSLVAQKIAAGTAAIQKADISNLTAGTANMTQAVIDKLVANTANFQKVKVENITATSTATLNSVVAQRIAAGTASFQTVDVKNLFVTGTASLQEAVAQRLAAETGTFIQLGVDQLTVSGTANMKDAVADRVFANLFSTRKLTANQIYVGQGGNLIGAPMDDSAWNDTASAVTRHADSGRNGGPSILVAPSTALVGSYMGIDAKERGKAPKLVPGAKYRLTAWFRGAGTIPAGGARLYLRFYPANTLSQDDWFFGPVSSVGSEGSTPSNTWKQVEGIFEVPDGMEVVGVPGVYTNTNTNVAVRFSDVVLQEAITPELVVEGAITAKHITASEEISAKLGQFMKLYSNQVIIGQPNNVIPDPNFLDDGQIARINQHSTAVVRRSSAGDLEMVATGTQYVRPLGVPQTVPGVSQWIPVRPGEVWEWGLEVSQMKDTNWLQFVGRTLDGSAYANPGNSTTVPAGSGTYVTRAKIPANCYWILPELRVTSGTQWIKKGSLFMRQVIDDSLIVDGSIVARHITASEEMAAKIGNFLRINASQVYIGGGANLVPDPKFNNPDKIMAIGNSGVGWTTYKSSSGAGSQAIQYAPKSATSGDGFLYPLGVSNAGAATKTEWIPCNAGEKYQYNWRAYTGGTDANTIQQRVYANVLLEDGTVTGVQASGWLTGKTGNLSAEFEIPANAKSFGITIQIKLARTVDSWWSIYGDNHSLVRLVDNALVVDGAITTKKLTVTADMTAALLKAKKVVAGEIDVNSLAADTAFVGLVDAKIVKSDMFNGKTFTGGTFTGTVFRTNASAATVGGVQFDSSGIRAWSPGGVQTLSVDASTGALDITGELRTGRDGTEIEITSYGNKETGKHTPAITWKSVRGAGFGPAMWVVNQADPNDAGHEEFIIKGTGTNGLTTGSPFIQMRKEGMVLMAPPQTAASGAKNKPNIALTHVGGMQIVGGGNNGLMAYPDETMSILGQMNNAFGQAMFRTGEVGGLSGALSPGQQTEYTVAIVPSTGGRLRPLVTIDVAAGGGGGLVAHAYGMTASTFKIRLHHPGSGATNLNGIHWLLIRAQAS